MRCVAFITLAFVASAAQALGAQSLPRMPSTMRTGLLARLDEAARKLEALADAIPAERYAWRPAAGVRSVSEVLVHVAAGNYLTAGGAGVPVPPGVALDVERTLTEKAAVLRFVRQSHEHLRSALTALPEGALDRPTTMFDQQTTVGNVYLFGIGHVQEHLEGASTQVPLDATRAWVAAAPDARLLLAPGAPHHVARGGRRWADPVA